MLDPKTIEASRQIPRPRCFAGASAVAWDILSERHGRLAERGARDDLHRPPMSRRAPGRWLSDGTISGPTRRPAAVPGPSRASSPRPGAFDERGSGAGSPGGGTSGPSPTAWAVTATATIAASRLVEMLASLEPEASGYGRLTEAARAGGRLERQVVRAAPDRRPHRFRPLSFMLVHEAHYACLWAGDSRALPPAQWADRRNHPGPQPGCRSWLRPARSTLTSAAPTPGAHVITRAVGAGPELELDHRFGPIEAGDIFPPLLGRPETAA